MDGISNQININFKLNQHKVISRELINASNYKLLADIEGELEIRLNELIFFKEQGILLLELGISLSKWLRKIDNEIYEDFTYNTMDYDESPILEFLKQQNNFWRIYSVWQTYSLEEEFSLKDFINIIEEFLNELREQLNKIYGINLDNFIK